MKKQYAVIDILKCICSLLVVAIHTAPLMDISADANFFVVQIVARLAVPFFFIISGYFVFTHIDMTKSWSDPDNLAYMKTYLKRICRLYILWTLLYLPLTVRDILQEGVSIAMILRYIRDFFLNGSYYHLWYLPGLVFAVPFIYYMLLRCGKRTTFFTVVILYIFGSFYNIFSPFLSDHSWIEWYGILFKTTRNGLFFGSLFIFLGAVLAHCEELMDKKTCLFAGVVSFIAMTGEVYAWKGLGYMHDLASMYLCLAPTVFFLFQYILQMEVPYRPFYKSLRGMSTFIYVSHIFFIVLFNILVPQWNALYIYIGVVLSCGLCSYVIVRLSHRYPKLKVLY